GFPGQGVGSNRPVKPKPRLRLALGSSGEQSGQLLWGHLEVASPLVANPVSSPAWTSPQSLSGSGGRTRIALAGTLAAAELSRQSRSGNGPRLRPRHSQDGPWNRSPARSVCTAAAVASLRARFSHSCGINLPLASLGLCARTCERCHGLFSPGSRPTASSQTLSASPTGLRARWACGLMVLGATKCWNDTCNGRFSSALRSPWSLRRAKWPLARIGLPMATSLSYPSDSIASHDLVQPRF